MCTSIINYVLLLHIYTYMYLYMYIYIYIYIRMAAHAYSRAEPWDCAHMCNYMCAVPQQWSSLVAKSLAIHWGALRVAARVLVLLALLG